MSSLRLRSRRSSLSCGLLACALSAVSCVSAEMKLVARSAAWQNYFQNSYEHRCPKAPDPRREAWCDACKATINGGVWQVQTANANQTLQFMPQAEREGLAELIVALERDCR